MLFSIYAVKSVVKE